MFQTLFFSSRPGFWRAKPRKSCYNLPLRLESGLNEGKKNTGECKLRSQRAALLSRGRLAVEAWDGASCSQLRVWATERLSEEGLQPCSTPRSSFIGSKPAPSAGLLPEGERVSRISSLRLSPSLPPHPCRPDHQGHLRRRLSEALWQQPKTPGK